MTPPLLVTHQGWFFSISTNFELRVFDETSAAGRVGEAFGVGGGGHVQSIERWLRPSPPPPRRTVAAANSRRRVEYVSGGNNIMEKTKFVFKRTTRVIFAPAHVLRPTAKHARHYTPRLPRLLQH